MPASSDSASKNNLGRHDDRSPALDESFVARLEQQIDFYAINNNLSKEAAASLVSAHFGKYAPKPQLTSSAA